jgi:hypothetical protein
MASMVRCCRVCRGFSFQCAECVVCGVQIWEYMEQNYPDVLGPVNPNNAAIVAQFGDQGGYN